MKNSSKFCLLAIIGMFFCSTSALAQGWPDTCAHLKEWDAYSPSDEVDAQMQYDTLRLYIEKCALSDNTSWQVFGHIDNGNQFRSNDYNRYSQYRGWLISVLYLNKIQPEYFCACMGSIGNTYQQTTQLLAVWNYLRQYHPECWGGAIANKAYSQDSISAIG